MAYQSAQIQTDLPNVYAQVVGARTAVPGRPPLRSGALRVRLPRRFAAWPRRPLGRDREIFRIFCSCPLTPYPDTGIVYSSANLIDGWGRKENDMATQVRYHANGLIDVDQGVHFGYRITYNPDDRRFYVQENDDDGDVLMTCGTMAEAVYAAHDLSNA